MEKITICEFPESEKDYWSNAFKFNTNKLPWEITGVHQQRLFQESQTTTLLRNYKWDKK